MPDWPHFSSGLEPGLVIELAALLAILLLMLFRVLPSKDRRGERWLARLADSLEDASVPTFRSGLRIGIWLLGVGAAIALALKILDDFLSSAPDSAVLGVPIAHVAAGALAVMAGTVAAVHAQRANLNQARQTEIDRIRGDRDWYAQWVGQAHSLHLHTAAWSNIEQLLDQDDTGAYVASTRRLAVDAATQYLVAACLHDSCSHVGNACPVHPLSTAWLDESLRVMEKCSVHPNADAESTSLHVHGRDIIRSADLRNAPPLAPVDLGTSRIAGGIELSLLRETLGQDQLPEVEDGGALRIAYSGRWEISGIGLRGKGKVILQAASRSQLIAESLIVPQGGQLEIDLSDTADCTISIEKIEVRGILSFVGASQEARITLAQAKDQGGLIKFFGSTFTDGIILIDCDAVEPSSGAFVQVDGARIMKDTRFDIRGLIPPASREGTRVLAVDRLTVDHGSIEIQASAFNATKISARFTKCDFVGDASNPTVIELMLEGSGAAAASTTFRDCSIVSANIALSHPRCTSGSVVVVPQPERAPSGKVVLTATEGSNRADGAWTYSGPVVDSGREGGSDEPAWEVINHGDVWLISDSQSGSPLEPEEPENTMKELVDR